MLKRMDLEILVSGQSRLTELTYIYQERGGLQHHNDMDKIQSVLLRTLLSFALLCLQGSCTTRHVPLNIQECHFIIDKELAGLMD